MSRDPVIRPMTLTAEGARAAALVRCQKKRRSSPATRSKKKALSQDPALGSTGIDNHPPLSLLSLTSKHPPQESAKAQ